MNNEIRDSDRRDRELDALAKVAPGGFGSRCPKKTEAAIWGGDCRFLDDARL